MRFELDQADVDLIAARIIEQLNTIIPKLPHRCQNDAFIFDVPGLANYLKVDPSWIYKQVQYGTLPHIKMGKYLRFSKSVIDKYLEKSTVQATSPVKLVR